MSDLRKDIPLGCAVNVAILNQVANSTTFKEACKNVPLNFGIKPPIPDMEWPFHNASWGGYMLYSQLVVPKELYKLDKNDSFFVKLVNENLMKDFTILLEKESFPANPKYHFDSLRNAVSHVNYEISEHSVHFWDHPPKKAEPENWHYSVKIGFDKIFAFLDQLSLANIEFYNQIKAGKRDSKGKTV
jgi:hypothetical protein